MSEAGDAEYLYLYQEIDRPLNLLDTEFGVQYPVVVRGGGLHNT